MSGVVGLDVPRSDGGVLRVHDRRPAGDVRLTVVWHHGTPNVGSPPAPLFAAADRLGVRWVGYDRPGYGGSSPRPDRDVASAAADVALTADALDLGRFAVMSHSGGGPHAVACAALLGRVVAAAVVSGLAPHDADELDWFAGMAEGGEAALRAAVAGRDAKEAFERAGADLDIGFTAADVAALRGDWAWFTDVVGPAQAAGPGPLVDDDLAFVRPWGVDVADVDVPLLVVHGTDDRVVPVSHGRWLAGRVRGAELREVAGAGHLSVMSSAEQALEWLVHRAVGETHSD